MAKTKAQQRKTRVKRRKVARTKAWKVSKYGRKRKHIIHPRELDRALNPAMREDKKTKGFFGRLLGKLFGKGGK